MKNTMKQMLLLLAAMVMLPLPAAADILDDIPANPDYLKKHKPGSKPGAPDNLGRLATGGKRVVMTVWADVTEANSDVRPVRESSYRLRQFLKKRLQDTASPSSLTILPSSLARKINFEGSSGRVSRSLCRPGTDYVLSVYYVLERGSDQQDINYSLYNCRTGKKIAVVEQVNSSGTRDSFPRSWKTSETFKKFVREYLLK